MAHPPQSPSSYFPTASLLGLPPEVRHQIYLHLFRPPNGIIKIHSSSPFFAPPPSPTTRTAAAVAANDDSSSSPLDTQDSDTSDPWSPTTVPHLASLSTQLLAVHPVLHHEAHDLPYNLSAFDITDRDALTLLTHAIPAPAFARITRIVLDWDQLIDFSFKLARPDFVARTAGLRALEMVHWRTRVLGGSSRLWRDVKAYERSLVGAALGVVQKSRALRVCAERPWTRQREEGGGGRVGGAGCGRGEAALTQLRRRQQVQQVQLASSSVRVKWRFVESEEVLWAEERVVDLEGEREEAVQMALDPF